MNLNFIAMPHYLDSARQARIAMTEQSPATMVEAQIETYTDAVNAEIKLSPATAAVCLCYRYRDCRNVHPPPHLPLGNISQRAREHLCRAISCVQLKCRGLFLIHSLNPLIAGSIAF